jgi:Fe-S-cluster containining protein
MTQQAFQQQLKTAFENERSLISSECGKEVDYDSLNTATVNFYRRLDNTITGVSAHIEQTIQCQQGCSYCCHFRVDVSANEVFAIVEHVQSIFTSNQLEKLVEKATNNKNKLAMLSQAKRIVTNMACPLLEDNVCSIYAMRPSMCRKMHSTDVEACQHSYDNPEDENIENAEHPVLSAITMTMLTAAREGFSTLGLDKTVYDLNEVLIVALSDSKYKKRWLNGKKAFP